MTVFREDVDGIFGFDVRGLVWKISGLKVGDKNPRIDDFFQSGFLSS